MPVYEFKCNKCEKIIEVQQKYTDNAPKCECGSDTERMISNTSFVLKGTGWYNSDYKKK